MTIKNEQLNALLIKACKLEPIVKKRKAQLDKLVAEIKDITKDMGIMTGSHDTVAVDFTVSFTPESFTVDTAKLKEKYPEIYADVCTKPKSAVYTLKSYKLKANSKSVTVTVK